MAKLVKEETFDVVVIGGGLAGICAALASARAGVKTALIEQRPVLGGNSSTEYRITPYSAAQHNPWAAETGIISEILAEERLRNHERLFYGSANAVWDLILYNKCKMQEGLTLFLNTAVHRVLLKSNDIIDQVVGLQLCSETEFRFTADIFIDATGDGVVGFEAGAEYAYGREAKNEFNEPSAPEKADNTVLGSSLLFRARNVGHPVPFEPPEWIVEYPNEEDFIYRSHRDIEGGYWWIEIGGERDTISDNENIKHDLLKHVLGIWDHIKNHGDHDADNYALEWVGMLPAKRESRRFIGDHVLTENEIREAKLFEDRVAYGGWCLDIHTPTGILNPSIPPNPFIGDKRTTLDFRPRPYSIPLRCLYSINIKNLFFAGRNISVTHMALSSTRIMLTCAVIGQAVGTAAAYCSRHGKYPRDLSLEQIKAIQVELIKNDCYLPHLPHNDPTDIARSASKVTASSEAVLSLPPSRMTRPLDVPTAALLPISRSEDWLDYVEVTLSNTSQQILKIRGRLLSADDIWDLNEGKCVAPIEAMVPPGMLVQVRFPFKMKLNNGLYWFCIDPCPGVSWHLAEGTGETLYNLGYDDEQDFENKQNYLDNENGTTTQVGLFSATKPFDDLDKWQWHRSVLSVNVFPPSYPFSPYNIISGPARSETGPNLWASDPNQELPQWICLEFNQEVTFNTLYLTFDTNLSRIYWLTPPRFRAPECVRDYDVEVLVNGRWELLFKERGNYQRRRIHRFPPVSTKQVKITIRATNGIRQARIYEVRLYYEDL